jgi:hypothetical protein
LRPPGHGCYCRVGLGKGKGTAARGASEGAGIHVGTYRSWGENQGGGVGFDAVAVIAAVASVGANSSGRIAPRRTSVARGGSGAIQIHTAYKAKAATPRISRSVILRATDRGAERRVSKTLGSIAITASERVTPGNSGTLAGAAEAIAGAGACALTGSSLAWREPTIEPTPADKPVYGFRADCRLQPTRRRYFSKGRAGTKGHRPWPTTALLMSATGHSVASNIGERPISGLRLGSKECGPWCPRAATRRALHRRIIIVYGS